MSYKLTKLERETIICYNEAESSAEVFTYNEAMKRRLAIIAEQRPKEIYMLRSTPYGAVEYRMPKKWVRVNPSRIISDEQRAILSTQAKKRFNKKD